MTYKKTTVSYIAIFVLCLLLLFLFLYNPAASSGQLYRGLELCAKTLIPALFPYMVISEMLVRSGAVSFIAPMTEGVVRKLFGISGEGGTALLLGILCGFPVGARIAAELYNKSIISKNEAERLMGICNLPSPPFIIFAVGERLFGSRSLGICMYVNILAATMLIGIFNRKREVSVSSASIGKNVPQPIFSVFTESVASASGSVIKVCAFVAFFSAFTGGLAPFLENVDPKFQAVIISFFELATGMASCSALANRSAGIIIASAAAGWSGISVLCQIFSASRTERGNISMRFYLTSRLLSAVMCGASASVFIKAFPRVLTSSPAAEDAIPAVSLYPDVFIAGANIIFTISLFIYLFKKLDRRHII